jgi:DnaJ-class molecular chaperone
MDAVQQAAQLLIEHTRSRIEDCHCGWGVNTGALGQSHALHVAQALADTTCHSCSGTGGTDLSGARCAVCGGTGHRRAER